MLTELQSQLNLPIYKLITDCPTRWNSTFYMQLLSVVAPDGATCIVSDNDDDDRAQEETPFRKKKTYLSDHFDEKVKNKKKAE